MRQVLETVGPGRTGAGACGDNVFSRFSPALLDPQQPVPAGVTGNGGKAAGKRFNVYRNNVTVSLVNALADTFPAIQRIVGEAFFRAMARVYVRQSPPTSRLLFEYGETFAAFIETFEPAVEMPWLADVARIERRWLDSYHAVDAPAVGPEHLAAIAPERLADTRFIPHPASHIIRSEFPAADIFAMNRQDGAARPLEDHSPQNALITRPDLEVTVRTLPLGGADFLQSLFDGNTLSQAAAATMGSTPTFDLPTNIAGMLEAGVFASVHRTAERWEP